MSEPMQTMQIITIQTQNAKSTIKKLNGRDHLVVPVIPIVEGVLNGALVEANEFNKYIYAWAGRPITVNHPMKNGLPVSASQADIIETQVIGQVMNPKALSKKLKAEMWIDIAKCNTLKGEALQVLQRLQSGQPLEVSTAYFPDVIKQAGIFNSPTGAKKYSEIHVNLRPDHLAALPNGIGACSWADGAGAPRVASKNEAEQREIVVLDMNLEDNTDQEGGEKVTENESNQDNQGNSDLNHLNHHPSVLEKILNSIKDFLGIGAGGIGDNGLEANEASYGQTRQALRDALKVESPLDWFYISDTDLYSDYFVYEHEFRVPVKPLGGITGVTAVPGTTNPFPTTELKTKYFKRSYTISEAGAVTLGADKQEVRKVQKYEPVIPPAAPSANENQENQETGKKESSINGNENPSANSANKEVKPLEKKKIIDALIANKQTILTEEDRPWLDKLEANQLQKMVPAETKPEETKPAANSSQPAGQPQTQPAAQPASQPAIPAANAAPQPARPKTTEEYLAEMPPGEAKDFIINGINQAKVYREQLITNLAANSKSAFTKEELAGFQNNVLEKIAKSIGIGIAANDYSGMGVPRMITPMAVNSNDNAIPPPPPCIMAKKEEAKQ